MLKKTLEAPYTTKLNHRIHLPPNHPEAGMAGALLWPSSSLIIAAARAARSAAACPSGDRATHSAASSAVAKLPRCTCLPPLLTCAVGLGLAGIVDVHGEVARPVLGHAQHQ